MSAEDDDKVKNHRKPSIFLLDKENKKSPMRVTSLDKWIIAVIITIVSIIIYLPFTYRLTNRVVGVAGFKTTKDTGIPNLFGIILHAVIFIIIIRLLMH